MQTPLTARRIAREWLIALTSYALLVAPFGCQFQDILDGSTDGDLTTSSTGLFLSNDTSKPLLVAGRAETGDAIFVFGKWATNGGIERVESVLVEAANGQRSFIVFDEEGRPTYLEGPDGSYVHITYTETTEDMFDATVRVHDATSDHTETVDVQIDLQELRDDLLAAAEQGAAIIQQYLDETLVVPDATSIGTAKAQQRALSTLLVAVVAIPLTIVVQFAIIVMGEIMRGVFEAVAETVAASVEAAMAAALTPLYAFSSVLSSTMYEVRITPLLDVFVDIPAPPVITIEY